MTPWQAGWVGYGIGVIVTVLALKVFYAREIAIGKAVIAAGYTKIEQVMAFLRNRV